MSGNSSSGMTPDITDLLPPSLDLPPHLSAHKYFFVCTLTVAAWDTLVLSPRTWRLLRLKGWPLLKVIYHFIRWFMPIEFAIVAVAFFDTKFTSTQCDRFYLFEPICTAILLSLCSLVHAIRISAIYPGNKLVKWGMFSLLGHQVVAMAITCGFYRPMPLKFPASPSFSGQGCIAGPKFADNQAVGTYWVLPTALYTASFLLALARSQQSLSVKQISAWKLMLRDGLNLYGAIWIVNMTNMLFWFIAKPDDNTDTIKTIVTSMAAVLTTTMTMRIILSIRGGLANGGSFHGSSTAHSSSHSASNSRGVNISNRGAMGVTSGTGTGPVISINTRGQPQTFAIGGDKEDASRWPAPVDVSNKEARSEYDGEGDGRSAHSIPYNPYKASSDETGLALGGKGVQVTIDKHTETGR